MDVGRGPLNGVRQVDDHFPFRSRLPDVDYGVAALEGEIQLGVGKRLGRVLQDDLGARDCGHKFFHQLRAVDRDLLDRFAGRIAECDAALERRGGVVNMDDGAFRPVDGLECPADQRLAGLDEDLHGDVVRDAVLVDEAAQEIEFRVCGGRETNLDLLEADADEQVEKL